MEQGKLETTLTYEKAHAVGLLPAILSVSFVSWSNVRKFYFLSHLELHWQGKSSRMKARISNLRCEMEDSNDSGTRVLCYVLSKLVNTHGIT